MTIKIAAFVMLTFCLVVNLNAYFVEYAGTPYIATQRDCTPVYIDSAINIRAIFA